jgi:lysozyme family protein
MSPWDTTDASIIEMILRHEGGEYTNHPSDRGGPTKWGVTIPVLSKHRGRPCSADDIQRLTKHEAGEVYRMLFIRPFDALPSSIRSNVIDAGVNSGVYRATILLQQCIGVDVDGKIGPKTIAGAESRDWNPLYVGVRLAFYEGIVRSDASQAVFRKGWRARALSFYGLQTRRLRQPGDYRPEFGLMGKAMAA